jgi:hypothetical protein
LGTGDERVAAAGAVQAPAMADERVRRFEPEQAEGAILDSIMASLHIR